MIILQPPEKSRLRKRRDGRQREGMRDFSLSKQCEYTLFLHKPWVRSAYEPSGPIRPKLIQGFVA